MSENSNSAEDCSCAGCISACKRYPGWFHPDQIAPTAAYLGLTIQEFFEQHLVIERADYYDENWEWIAAVGGLAPARIYMIPGTSVSTASSEPARCTFLDSSNRCSIHPVKPRECRDMSCVDNTDEVNHRKVAQRAWLGNQEIIDALDEKEFIFKP